MTKHITNIYGQGYSSTAMLTQHMMTNIAKKSDYSEIDVPNFPVADDSPEELRKRIDGIITAIQPGDMVLAQMPTWNGIAFDEVFIDKILEKNIKLAIFIHDFVPLMFENNFFLMERYLNTYNKAEIVVVPSNKMGNILLEHGLTAPFIVQDIWDHAINLQNMEVPKFSRALQFAGNITRFPFVKNWKSDIPLNVYSQSYGVDTSNLSINLKGWQTDDQLMRALASGGFGLVWSENIENQAEREYSTMNVSSKFSSYLAAGLPIIVNRGIAKERFVEKYGLGYAVDSLDEAADIVRNIKQDEYDILCKNVQKMSFLVREGFFGRKLLIDIERNIYLGH